MTRHLYPVLLLSLLTPLAGCDGASSTPAESPRKIAARAATLTPADPRLAALYETSCRACHASAEAGAPLAGDTRAWAPRWDKGMPILVEHTISGFNGMPAGGQCFSCEPADYEALIRFLAGHGPAREGTPS